MNRFKIVLSGILLLVLAVLIIVAQHRLQASSPVAAPLMTTSIQPTPPNSNDIHITKIYLTVYDRHYITVLSFNGILSGTDAIQRNRILSYSTFTFNISTNITGIPGSVMMYSFDMPYTRNGTLARISTTTPGFGILNITPKLPFSFTLDTVHQQFNVTLALPKARYNGSLSIELNVS